MVIYLYDLQHQSNIDSAVIANESFQLQGSVLHPKVMYLRFATNPNYADLVIENTHIQFEANLEDMLLGSKIQGGNEQSLKNRLSELTRSYDRIWMRIGDSLQRATYVDSVHQSQLIQRHREYLGKSMELLRSFIVEHPNSYFTLDLLFRNRQFIPKEQLMVAYEKLQPEYQATADAKRLFSFLTENEGELEVGQDLVDFQANDLTGKSYRLSEFKGSFIYLSFWSTGCKPCRKENRFFSENYNDLPSELQLISFSTDRSKELWEKASLEDNIKWTNLSDLQGPKGSVATAYGVVALPHSLLIGKNGKIIRKFTGYSDQIYEELLEAMEHSI